MNEIEVGLLGLIVAMIGIGTGKIWANRKLEKHAEETTLLVKKIQRNFEDMHSRCFGACNPERIKKEHELEMQQKELTIEVKERLNNLFTRQTEVFKLLEGQKSRMDIHFLRAEKIFSLIERNNKKI